MTHILRNDLEISAAVRAFRYNRLSSTSRPQAGSSRIEGRGRVEMKSLLARLEHVPFGMDVTSVGLTDDVGASEGNRHLKVWGSNTAEDQIVFSEPQILQALTY